MFKVIWLARFPQGMPKQDARKHWSEVHAPICASTDIPRYIQNHVAGPVPAITGVADEEPQFDGYSLGWWEDRNAFDETMASPGWQALVEDGDNVFDMPWLEGMSAQVREHPVIEGPSAPLKVVWIVRFKEGLDPAEGHRHWEQTHGPIFKKLDIERYVQNHVVGPLDDEHTPGFDGFSECWFKDRDQFITAVESEAWAEAVADGDNVFDMSQMWGAELKENFVKL